jgi:hypothetical protein
MINAPYTYDIGFERSNGTGHRQANDGELRLTKRKYETEQEDSSTIRESALDPEKHPPRYKRTRRSSVACTVETVCDSKASQDATARHTPEESQPTTDLVTLGNGTGTTTDVAWRDTTAGSQSDGNLAQRAYACHAPCPKETPPEGLPTEDMANTGSEHGHERCFQAPFVGARKQNFETYTASIGTTNISSETSPTTPDSSVDNPTPGSSADCRSCMNDNSQSVGRLPSPTPHQDTPQDNQLGSSQAVERLPVTTCVPQFDLSYSFPRYAYRPQRHPMATEHTEAGAANKPPATGMEGENTPVTDGEVTEDIDRDPGTPPDYFNAKKFWQFNPKIGRFQHWFEETQTMIYYPIDFD